MIDGHIFSSCEDELQKRIQAVGVSNAPESLLIGYLIVAQLSAIDHNIDCVSAEVDELKPGGPRFGQ